MPGFLLCLLAPSLALPLSIIYQQSLAQLVFPSCWTTAIVVPIYKVKGMETHPSNYRPISLCSTLGKTLERVVKDQLMFIISTTNKLSSVQHEFSQNRSTSTNLSIAEHDIADAINEHEPMEIIAFDFSRAFDRVPHPLLLQKLARHKISGSALD